MDRAKGKDYLPPRIIVRRCSGPMSLVTRQGSDSGSLRGDQLSERTTGNDAELRSPN